MSSSGIFFARDFPPTARVRPVARMLVPRIPTVYIHIQPPALPGAPEDAVTFLMFVFLDLSEALAQGHLLNEHWMSQEWFAVSTRLLLALISDPLFCPPPLLSNSIPHHTSPLVEPQIYPNLPATNAFLQSLSF